MFVYVCICACMHVCVHVCVHACMCVHVCCWKLVLPDYIIIVRSHGASPKAYSAWQVLL